MTNRNRQSKTVKIEAPLDPALSPEEAIRILRKRMWGFFEDFPFTDVENKLLLLGRIDLIEAAYPALANAIHSQFFDDKNWHLIPHHWFVIRHLAGLPNGSVRSGLHFGAYAESGE